VFRIWIGIVVISLEHGSSFFCKFFREIIFKKSLKAQYLERKNAPKLYGKTNLSNFFFLNGAGSKSNSKSGNRTGPTSNNLPYGSENLIYDPEHCFSCPENKYFLTVYKHRNKLCEIITTNPVKAWRK
jgi:hypothetical protein